MSYLEGVWRYPLDANKDVNDQTLLIRIIEDNVREMNRIQRRIEDVARQLRSMELSCYAREE